ncbi:TATA-box binding protein [Tumebacillus sp. BK434]|uniref:YwmB family TATA-box binding protein n=1 Tax=Tumebacillus sp. BK434 TaxID=2512169 RepID=UPI0010EA426A|nr:YwmB family TATA-box binding protein [Tumebacillus sp. BK434]TCP57754.1 TATA-box binding protein [Tumebacillus sp. BK434]
MKKIGILGIICCLIAAAFSLFSARETIAEKADTGAFLNMAFAETGADVEGWQVHNWSALDKEYKSADDLKALGLSLNKTFAIQQAQESVQAQGDQASFTLRGKWQNGAAAQLTLTSMKFQNHAPQTVLVLRVERDAKDLGDYAAAIKRVSETAKLANTTPQISTCIKGLRADKMDNVARNSMVKAVFQEVKAKEIEGVRSELVTSVSGYSPLTKDYIVTNGNKMNLQVAAHFDETLGKTRVLVGTPIVTIEY